MTRTKRNRMIRELYQRGYSHQEIVDFMQQKSLTLRTIQTITKRIFELW